MDLTGISAPDLERFRRAIDAGRLTFPLSLAALQCEGLGGFKSALVAMNTTGKESSLEVVAAVLAERASRPSPPSLVWTGPESTSSGARDTAVVLQELCGNASRSILIAGFAFDHASVVLLPLHQALTRGVQVRVFVDGPVARAFLKEHWPFGPPFPELHGFTPEPGIFSSLHAKCVVVDRRWVFITSANFTDRGQTRNVEVGVTFEDPRLAELLEAQFVGGEWFAREPTGARVM